MAGEIFTAIATPVPFQRIVDTLVKTLKGAHGRPVTAHALTAQLPRLGLLAAIFVVIAILDGLFAYFDARNSARVAQTALTDLRRALFNHIQRLSLSFHHDRETRLGELQTRLSGDVSNLQDLVATQLSVFITSGGTAIFMLVALFLLNRWIGLLVVAGACPVYLAARHYRRHLREAVRDARRQEGEISSILSESLSAAKLVQTLGREDFHSGRLRTATDRGLTFGLRAADLQARVQPLLALSTDLMIAVVLVVSALMVLRKTLTLGELTLVLFYTRSALASARQLAKLPIQSQKSAVSAERLREMFARAPAVREPPHPTALPTGALDISFEGVSFGYLPRRPVFEDLEWRIPAGTTTALVGPTGAGKSTLLSLVPRLYDPWKGSVRVGGVDVSQVAFRELRTRVTCILQETLLFRDTIWDNIAYGSPTASEDAILAAAAAAGVTAFADQLEDGLDTVVSERGATLSGGQKQCVAIARALLRDASVVIMDEPTSSLDAITEQAVIQGMNRLVQGKTAVIIAHRFSTIQHADRVAVMEHGAIAQEGTPAELLAQPGLYASLFERQETHATRDYRLPA
jgi:ATP-binding cassette subfamily B protein/subfamily B ATP-binding cassette protein MsbA